MSIKADISSLIKVAMKERATLKLSTLRMLLSDTKYFEIASGREATDDDIAKIVATSIKKRNESVVQYRLAGRTELADKEEAEIAILKIFAPAQMEVAEIGRIVGEVIASLEATGPQSTGQVMKEVMVRVAGKADGKVVSEIVKKALAH